jgi:N utilization substance protein B
VQSRAGELDERLNSALEGWTADRLGALERNILRIAVHEIESGEVPDEVAINEAVELAKRYTTDEAARLVNGALGKIAREGGSE